MSEALLAHLDDADATRELGRRVAELCRDGDVIALCGPLGAGKTTFVQGLAKGLDVPPSVAVRSPTFALANEYPGRLAVLHIDLYRIASEAEAEDLGFAEHAGTVGVAVVEWADRLPDLLPGHALWIELEHAGDGRRVIAWEPDEPLGVVGIGSPGSTGEERWTETDRVPPWERSSSG